MLNHGQATLGIMTDLFSWRPRTQSPPRPLTGDLGGPGHLDPDRWLRQLFGSQIAQDGGVVRRKVRDVDRIVGRDAFEAELRRRGYRAIENCGHYVVFCNRDTLRVIG